MNGFSTNITAGLFVVAALMYWSGWTLLPTRIGVFFEAGDFPKIQRRFRTWIWLFRLHLFGHVTAVMAFVALATLLSDAQTRVLVWPAVAVLATGLVVAALAAAFYYHFGAWGARDMQQRSASEVRSFIETLKVPTEYVTCLVRFGRVFFGLGQVVLAIGIAYGGYWPSWLVLVTALLGLSAMIVTMSFPDNLEYYSPIFHLNSAWMLLIGPVMLSQGFEGNLR